MYVENLEYIKTKLNKNQDVRYKNINLPTGVLTLIFIENLVDKDFINNFIISPLLKDQKEQLSIDIIINRTLLCISTAKLLHIDDCVHQILSGEVIILSSFSDKVIICNAEKSVHRLVEKSINEPVIKGSQEGFNESISDNINLIRKRVKNQSLKIEEFHLGTDSNSSVILMYIENKAPEKLVNLFNKTINNLKVEYILDTNYIEEELKCKGTDFDTIGYTEKPDILASKLYQGRVAVLVDNCPTAITAPYFFIEYFHAPDDYYLNKNVIDLVRILRVFTFFLTVFLPGFYIALFTHHSSLIPPTFVFKIAESRAGVPFPTIIEVLIMLFFFELTREASKRMPSTIGQSLSMVSSLILGQAAIGAGLASEGTIVIAGIYAITSFINPKLSSITPIWTLMNVAVSGMFGLHGFFIFLILIIAHIASLNSCGYPYLFPIGTPNEFKNKGKDYITRGRLKEISGKIFWRSKKA
ncbi:spore germination protein [Candidatus Clostridium radicumherbarum]|uniref:Spore germination protein n=1 Tax=Candidatus Clostridium radicumherbarum TaxID=3381662 RepID=A0ABW8TU26_9CLOT